MGATMPIPLMRTGPKGLALIKECEGCRLTSYQDSVGVWTVGVGHTAAAGVPIPKEGLSITAQDADLILARDLVRYEKAICTAVSVPLSQEQFDALVSFTFNVGPGNLQSSTLLKKLNAGNYAAVPDELKKWTKAGGKELPGLVRRRDAEAMLWSTGASPAITQTPPDIEPIPPKLSFWARLFAALFRRSA